MESKLSDYRIKKTKEHLEVLELRIGGKLRPISRYQPHWCPLNNFLPDEDHNGFSYSGIGLNEVFYGHSLIGDPGHYSKLVDQKTLIWWKFLSPKNREILTRRIQKWIQKRS